MNIRKKKIPRMSKCKWLDLQTLGSQSIMPKNLPYQWPQPLHPKNECTGCFALAPHPMGARCEGKVIIRLP